MSDSNKQASDVYIDEKNAFPNSVVPVATAVPAFIGYTPKAEYGGESYTNVAYKITSMAEFEAIYCFPNPTPPADPVKQYDPQYYLVAQRERPSQGKYIKIRNSFYSILPDPNTIYYLYNSVRLFFENGGAGAYIVSVGGYGLPSKKPVEQSAQIVNDNVSLNDLKTGLELLIKQREPTMYICPEATLLSPQENAILTQVMLLQTEEMETSLAIFDIIGGRDPDPLTWYRDIQNFRNSTGVRGLKYGVCYYPFVGTNMMGPSDIDYRNLFGGNIKSLSALINPPDAPNSAVKKVLDMIEKPPVDPMTPRQYNALLETASKAYALIMKYILADVNLIPPSGGMAGVYANNDDTYGVWQAPENTSMYGVVSVPILFSDSDQAGLSVDAVSGKSINSIRFFPGQGILVWGARTLDGNSMDWRYVSVRRTMTFLEQSVKLAARAYIFELNDSNTWSAVKSMIGSFLTSVWKQGGLQGKSPADAFSVDIGLGSTMSPEDLLNGFMRVTVKVAVVRPAEFIVFTFEQQMAKSD